MPSLRDIESGLATLWLNKEAREWLLGKRKGPIPECLRNVPDEILVAVDRKGVALYGNLISYGHRDVMESIYPFTMKLLGKKWEAIVEDYLLRFPPEHHNFNRLCSRFSQYFTLYGAELLGRYPFLAELADYEWIELEKLEEDVDIETHPHTPMETPDEISSLCPVVNPTLTVRDYKYNILEIADCLENDRKLPRKVQPERTLVAIYRHPETNRCKFLEIGEAAAHVIEAARKDVTYVSLIPIVVSLTPEMAPQESVAQFLDLVEELQELGLFVGSVKQRS